jgi:hypothetical protein
LNKREIHIPQSRHARDPKQDTFAPKICKEAVKMVVQLMIEDIWSNLDNYMLQRKVMKQS